MELSARNSCNYQAFFFFLISRVTTLIRHYFTSTVYAMNVLSLYVKLLI